MKTPLLTFLLLSFGLTAAAQKTWSEKSYLSFRGGLAQPLGLFDSKYNSTDSEGLADNGFPVGAESGAFLNKYVGLGASFTMRRNAVDVSNQPLYTGSNPIHVHTKWRSNFLLLHLIGSYPFSGSFAVYGKLSGGASFNTYPELSYSTASTATNKDRLKAEALAYSPAVGLKFLPGTVGLTYEASVLYTKPVFKSGSQTVQQAMNTLNHSLALHFKLK